MTRLQRFVERCIKQVDLVSPASFKADAADTLEITQISPHGIAAHAGLAPQDRLLLVNGAPAIDTRLDTYVDQDRQQVLLVERANGSERLLIQTNGASPGFATRRLVEVETRASLEALEDCRDLLELWNRGEWNELRAACEKRLKIDLKTKVSLLMARRPLKSFPPQLLLAAARYELGDRIDATRRIHEFRLRYEELWPAQYKAVTRYYEARDKLKFNDAEHAQHRLVEAIELWPCQRIEQCLAELHGRRKHRRINWVGKMLPQDYALDALESSGSVRLSESLNAMDPHQVMFIALMGGFRANENYQKFMLRFVHLAHHFSPFVADLHVITTAAERTVGVSTPENLRAEDKAKWLGVPFSVIYDRDRSLTDRINPRVSPELFVLDSRGTILREGMLDDLQWWELLHEVSTRAGQ